MASTSSETCQVTFKPLKRGIAIKKIINSSLAWVFWLFTQLLIRATPFPRRRYGGETYQRDRGRGVPCMYLLQQCRRVIPEQRSPGFHWFLLAPRQLERERGKISLPKDLHWLKPVLTVGSRIEKCTASHCTGSIQGMNTHWEPVIHSNVRE